ncbi:D-alanine transaminase/branched-chain amino acid aminotransferase [Dyadobacter jejuensis]|uniref:branched-chain-amino-acid transaminase n=1 Tax=Dyadobacter jejuensis TaxID=1082580 RepID=A0A316AHA8_9BACT|nr:aminotransferase class IV [Dyadobacter jejuensis]PWJ57021.1 D-alanine transaminase/branched-chain amino acid aminotransferase [Dyadobacter jejuensis]
MALYQYFNGQILPLEERIFTSNDLGLIRGYGLFDFFRTYNGVPFRWDDYWERFENSARSLKLTLPIGKQEAYAVLLDLYARSEAPEVAFRFLLTGGIAADSVHVESPNMVIRTESLPVDHPQGRLQGIKVLPYSYVRDLPTIKTTNYVHMILMADEMKQQQASDLLFHKDGEVSELTRSNVFLVKEGRLITTDRHILYGITRKVVLELAQDLMDIEIRPIYLPEMLEADEVFTTSSTKWVMPIRQIGDTTIGQGAVGPYTRVLQERFEALLASWGKS